MHRITRRVRAIAIVAGVLPIFACGSAGDDAKTADSISAPGTFALDDFRRLRWLEGRWVGLMPDGAKFYEEYRFTDDSTIVMHSFSDSTFGRATDSSRIVLRGQTVASESATARWVAVRIDTLGAEFGPQRGARNHFAWSRESNDAWTATLRDTDQAGRSRSVVYSLQRTR